MTRRPRKNRTLRPPRARMDGSAWDTGDAVGKSGGTPDDDAERQEAELDNTSHDRERSDEEELLVPGRD